MVLLEDKLGLEDEKENKRAGKRALVAKAEAAKRGANFAPQYHNPSKRTQIAAKFIRWLRHCLGSNLPVLEAVRALRRVYATF